MQNKGTVYCIAEFPVTQSAKSMPSSML